MPLHHLQPVRLALAVAAAITLGSAIGAGQSGAPSVGNWHLVRGDQAQARRAFERSIQSSGWPGFGFIASEAEMRRLR